MSPNELSIMLDQWARANAANFGIVVEGVTVAILNLADEEMVDGDGDRGGFFPFSVATLTIVRPTILSDKEALLAGVSINLIRRRNEMIDQFECLFLQLCHDIWMNKDLAVRGRVVVR